MASPAEIRFGEATLEELEDIVALLTDDVLGSTRESQDLQSYRAAFDEISEDPHQHLLVGRRGRDVVATLQLSLIPCLSLGATKRAQIESVRVRRDLRGTGVGQDLIAWALELAQSRGCGLVQLTTDHRRPEALRFYERLGFVASHHGMKLRL